MSVWEFGKGRDKNRLTLKESLFGHNEPVTCLAASSAYNVIISGSRDRTCILWDLSQLCFVRQLHGHVAPVAAVYINELTVFINRSCSKRSLMIFYCWRLIGRTGSIKYSSLLRFRHCLTLKSISEKDCRFIHFWLFIFASTGLGTSMCKFAWLLSTCRYGSRLNLSLKTLQGYATDQMENVEQ